MQTYWKCSGMSERTHNFSPSAIAVSDLCCHLRIPCHGNAFWGFSIMLNYKLSALGLFWGNLPERSTLTAHLFNYPRLVDTQIGLPWKYRYRVTFNHHLLQLHQLIIIQS